MYFYTNIKGDIYNYINTFYLNVNKLNLKGGTKNYSNREYQLPLGNEI